MDATAIRIAPFAESEIQICEEVADTADHNYRLLAQWDGNGHIIVWDAQHADALASIATEWANDIDKDLDAGQYEDSPEVRRFYRNVALGLWAWAEKARNYASKAKVTQ